MDTVEKRSGDELDLGLMLAYLVRPVEGSSWKYFLNVNDRGILVARSDANKTHSIMFNLTMAYLCRYRMAWL